jgi:hypothetical protein
VDFSGSNTTITLAYKREPGVVAENITESQFATLQRKNYNVFTNVNNGTAIVFAGKMANGDYFDERHGADWLQNRIQTDVYNLLYLSPTKIPQTDAGMNQIKAVITAACQVAVNNGFVAGGRVWTGRYAHLRLLHLRACGLHAERRRSVCPQVGPLPGVPDARRRRAPDHHFCPPQPLTRGRTLWIPSLIRSSTFRPLLRAPAATSRSLKAASPRRASRSR